MTGAQRIDVTGGTLAAGLFVAFAGAAFLTLSWAATPADFKGRFSGAQTRIVAAEAVLTKTRRPTAFPASAVCADSAERGALALRNRIETLAGQSGVTLTSLAAAPMGADEAVAPIGLQFEAAGRYDQVVSMLAGLARQTPTVFVDGADLSSQVSSVDFKFTGRVYCSARP